MSFNTILLLQLSSLSLTSKYTIVFTSAIYIHQSTRTYLYLFVFLLNTFRITLKKIKLKNIVTTFVIFNENLKLTNL